MPGTPKIKGIAVIGVVKLLRRARKAAGEALPWALHGYLERRILPSAWYPEEDFDLLVRAAGRLQIGAHRTHFEGLGRQQAEQDLGGIYRVMLRRGDPLATLEQLGDLWRLYHDAGTVQVTFEGADRASVLLTGYPFAGADLCALHTGYLTAALTLAGAEEPMVGKQRCRAAGQGLCRWSVRWRRPAPNRPRQAVQSTP